MNDHKIERNYTINTAGKDWVVDKVKFIKDFEGDLSISRKEIRRIHEAIAIEIISHDDSLDYEEFEFLCSISDTSFAECADVIRVNKSSISQWKGKKSPIQYPTSVMLKDYFLSKIFPEGNRRDLFGKQVTKTKEFALNKKLIEKHISGPIAA